MSGATRNAPTPSPVPRELILFDAKARAIFLSELRLLLLLLRFPKLT